ncbi:MAG: hypothetical protein DRQ35_05735 [Gammaproteobacteria bacterium]|nr:MAG: hypothetical protein DRQ35_05735 [Gammaproteobacteria bacterium]
MDDVITLEAIMKAKKLMDEAAPPKRMPVIISTDTAVRMCEHFDVTIEELRRNPDLLILPKIFTYD